MLRAEALEERRIRSEREIGGRTLQRPAHLEPHERRARVRVIRPALQRNGRPVDRHRDVLADEGKDIRHGGIERLPRHPLVRAGAGRKVREDLVEAQESRPHPLAWA